MRLRNLSRLAAGYLYYGRQGKQTPQETQYIYDGEDTIFLKNSNISSSCTKKGKHVYTTAFWGSPT